MAKSFPSFQFYPADFLVGTAYLDHVSLATYTLLLCYQWTNERLPKDMVQLAKITRHSSEDFADIWVNIEDKFAYDDDGHPYNERLETVREEALTRSLKYQEAGRKGGLKKRLSNAKAKPKRRCSHLKTEDRRLKTEDRNLKIEEVVASYKKHHPRSQAGDKEIKLIERRLEEGFDTEDLLLAIEGCHVSPWHCGQNKDGRKYQSLDLILRDASKVTQFIEHAQQRGDESLSERSRKSLNAIGSWLERKRESA